MFSRRAWTVTGLGFGDEGKGSIVDFLCRGHAPTLVVRHNGGAQAAHRVVLPGGKEHVFSQWGAGTFAGARTFLSAHMVTHPIAMLNEAKHLQDVGILNPYDLVTVSPRAKVATPYHQEMNRLREMARGEGRHGSCGMGIGEAVVDAHKAHALTWADLTNYAAATMKLRAIRDEKLAEATDLGLDRDEAMGRLQAIDFDMAVDLMQMAARLIVVEPDEEKILTKYQTVIFEGAQGVLLDQDYGFQPHTTWSRCTDINALEMAGADFEVTRIGVVRAYATRHGPGPFPTFDQALTNALPDARNGFDRWQREFRCGWFDAPLTRYAIMANDGIDALAVTNVDRLADLRFKICVNHNPYLSESYNDVNHALDAIRRWTGQRIAITSHGPAWQDKRLPADAVITLS